MIVDVRQFLVKEMHNHFVEWLRLGKPERGWAMVITLTEVCLAALPPEERPWAKHALNYVLDTVGVDAFEDFEDYMAYVDENGPLWRDP